MRFTQGIFLLFIAASLWLWVVEGFVSALLFCVFGLIVVGALGFALQIGDAIGSFADRFIRRHSRRQ